LQAIRAAAIDW